MSRIRRRSVLKPEWVTIDDLGRLLLKPETGRTAAAYQKRLGMTPTGMQTDADGDTVIQFAMDPSKAYDAQVWYLKSMVDGVEIEYEDGTAAAANDELFEAIIDAQMFPKVKAECERLGAVRTEELEKN